MGWFFLQEKYAFYVINILGKAGSDNEMINQLIKYIYNDIVKRRKRLKIGLCCL